MNMNMRFIVLPQLLDISRQQDTGSCFAVIQGFDSFYLDTISKPSAIITKQMRIGKDAPLHCSGSGKIFLSQMKPEHVDEYIEKKGLTRLTDYTITSKCELLKELENIRESGFAMDREECDLGVTCIAVPVFDYTDKVLGAISAFDSTDEFTYERRLATLLELQKRAITITKLFGCSDYPIRRIDPEDKLNLSDRRE